MSVLDILWNNNKNSQNEMSKTQGRLDETSFAPSISLPSSESISEVRTFSKRNMQSINLGGSFTMVPLGEYIFNEKNVLMIGVLAGCTPELARWLPGYDLSTPEAIIKHLKASILRTEMGLGFTYLIKKNNGIGGMVFVDTPIYNETTIGFPHWTVDFFLFAPFQGKNLMPKILFGFMIFLKNVFKIHNIYSIVDSKNIQCLKMLDKCRFFKKESFAVFTDPNTGNKAIAFKCDLTVIEDPFDDLR